jgi:hypothetical protein
MTLFLPILITGFGLSFVFVPISTAAYGTLDNTQIGNASGLFNLMRNVGGSIGISIATTLLTRRAAAHQNDLTNYMPQSGAAYQNSLGGAQQAVSGYFGPAHSLFPAPALPAARPPGPRMGLRRRLPLALHHPLLLHGNRLVLQESETRQSPGWRPLRQHDLTGKEVP